MSGTNLSRRSLLSGLSAAAALPLSAQSRSFPPKFLWGAATAAYQVEGNNINSDLWVLEYLQPSMFQEKSADACDHYHRYIEDIDTLAKLGLNSYRFSIEWARLEPEPGQYSLAERDHYRRMLAACRERGITPMVTLSHFTNPRWVAAQGGWDNPETVDRFVRFTEFSAKGLGDLMGAACTFNEPDIAQLLAWMTLDIPVGAAAGMMAMAAKKVGSDRFSCFIFVNPEKARANMIAAHRKAFDALKSGPGKFPVGVTLAMSDDQAAGPDSGRDRKRKEVYGLWLETARKDDFIGVQTYTRSRVGPDKDLPPEQGARLTQMGYEFYPEALEGTIRYAAAEARVPVIVTENGIATDDDTQRVEYIQRALAGVSNCLKDGIDVRGYYHWSFMDNWEWTFGYKPKFGLIAVDRTTFQRTVKPSAKLLGEIARANRI